MAAKQRKKGKLKRRKDLNQQTHGAKVSYKGQQHINATENLYQWVKSMASMDETIFGCKVPKEDLEQENSVSQSEYTINLSKILELFEK